jgi:protocatechuate 3,4-dioxygenase, alpha subunit
MDSIPTPSQTVGPFFHLGCTDTHSVKCIAGPDAKGEHIRLICRVLDGDGLPVDDAMIEIWQADSEGKYQDRNQDRNEAQADQYCSGFGRMPTDAKGICIFETIKPGRVLGLDGKLQAPHLNVSVFARGVLTRLATRIYFADDPSNRECPILALVPEERRATLMARLDSSDADSSDPKIGNWYFDVRLCGKDETVYFDV